MATKSFLLGMEAKAYFGESPVADPSTLTPVAMTELDNVTDVTLSTETGQADITTRANQGWRGTAATLKECSVDFEMIWKPGDAGFEALKAAWLNSNDIALCFLSEAHSESTAEGPLGSWTVTNFSRSEPLEEAIKVSVTVKLAVFTNWYKGT